MRDASPQFNYTHGYFAAGTLLPKKQIPLIFFSWESNQTIYIQISTLVIQGHAPGSSSYKNHHTIKFARVNIRIYGVDNNVFVSSQNLQMVRSVPAFFVRTWF